ncbi:MAG: penicillin-binding protein, partial [Micrococcales bacterium]|nr:penicillin-binding protein [Micrococcales bacterium]
MRRVAWTALGAFVLGLAGFFVAYALTDVPQPNEMVTAQASIVYYSDGKTEMARLSDEGGNRTSVKLADISPNMQHAILAAEDRDFYQNSGISPTGIARAVWVAIKGGQATQGGSTITQQYVKNYFLTQDRTLSRKAREILISLKIDKQQSKDQILENYLNTIYYGRGAYGIETASRSYFGVSAKDLTPAQAALLAAVIRGPSFYDPTLGDQQKANAEKRSAYILDAMVAKNWLTPAERQKATFPKVLAYTPRRLSGPLGYSVDLIKKELIGKYKLTDADIQRGGLKIISTIDRARQRAAVDAVRAERPDQADVHEGLVSIKPGDGAVVALYGGSDYAKRELNNATQAKMQAGSTFKIFSLIAALQSGKVSTQSRFQGYSPQYFPEFADKGASSSNARRGRVENFGNEQFGNIDLLTATGHSVNTVYAQLNILADPKNTMKAAQDAGVRSKLAPNMSDVLGTDYVSVMDMATAYATIAAQGVRAEPYLVKQVDFPAGGAAPIKVKPKTQQVFDKDLMSDVIDAMQQPTKSGGTASYVGQNLGRPAAGKTGTSESFRSAWFDGYVPQLATAVGLYRADKNGGELPMENLPKAGDITGGTYPTRIWTAYMKAALQGLSVAAFPEPAHINKDANPPSPTTSAPPPTTSAPPSTTAPPPSTTA